MVTEGKNATSAAIAATNEAKRQADFAEQSFKRLERPYLFIEIVETNYLNNPGQEKPRLHYKLTNLGKTPAIFKSIFLELRPLSDLQYRDGKPYIPISAPAKRWYEVLAQGQSTGNRPVEVLDSKTGQRINTIDISLALHGRLEYEDPTRALHTHHFVLSTQGGRFCLEWGEDHTEYPKENVT